MEDQYFSYAAISLFFILLVLKFFLTKTSHVNLPPSPPSIPIFGHLHLMKHPVHKTLQKISEKYGPLFSLRFGSQIFVVVSSPAVVHECFTKNDIVLANRPRSLAAKHLAYNYNMLSFSNYGDYWRNLRRLCAIEVFSSSRLNVYSATRRDEVNRLMIGISLNSCEFKKVQLQSRFSELAFNIMMKMVAGKRYYGDDVSNKEEANQFIGIVKEIVMHLESINSADFLPCLNWVTGNKHEKKLIDLGSRSDTLLQGLIDEHRNNKSKENDAKSLITHLLSLQDSEPDNYSDQIIKPLILVMLLPGIDTSSVTLEWAMAHLLNNREVLKKARDELDSKIGCERLVEEYDMPKLHYIQGILSETLRLSPATPLLLPHYASDNCNIAGYNVPKDTIVLVNAWAMQRDPALWEEAWRFKPERHEKSEGGELQKLLPFGLGRRACPGVGLAQRVIGLTLASLIQCYEWERVGNEEVDMSEGQGITMPRVVPLEAMCKPRPIMANVLTQL